MVNLIRWKSICKSQCIFMLFFFVVTRFSGKWLRYYVAKARTVIHYSLAGYTTYVCVLLLCLPLFPVLTFWTILLFMLILQDSIMTFLQQNSLWKLHSVPETKYRIWTNLLYKSLLQLWTPPNSVHFQFGSLHLLHKLWLDSVLYAPRRAQAARQKYPPPLSFFFFLPAL